MQRRGTLEAATRPNPSRPETTFPLPSCPAPGAKKNTNQAHMNVKLPVNEATACCLQLAFEARPIASQLAGAPSPPRLCSSADQLVVVLGGDLLDAEVATTPAGARQERVRSCASKVQSTQRAVVTTPQSLKQQSYLHKPPKICQCFNVG